MSNNNCSLFNFETITCTQADIGFDFTKILTFTDASGAVIDITGETFVMTIKDVLSGSTLLTLSIVGDNLTTGFFIPSPTTGIINMQITDTDTGLIAAGFYPYETIRTDVDSKKTVFMQGNIQFFSRGF